MLNVAMLSKWHVHAEGYARQLLATGKVKITAVWDEDADRGGKWAEQLGCDFEACLDTLLSRDDVDAVICDTPTTEHEEVMIKAAEAGKHIFTEKAMAPTVEECERISNAVKKSGVTFLISMPQRTTALIQYAKKLIEDGTFGKISLVRIRNGHNGVSKNWLPAYWYDTTKTAGGSLMDLGCHPMYTAPYLLGKPKRITSILTELYNTGSDEAAAAIIEFENGATAICETSFLSHSTPGSVEIYGTDATLIAIGDEIKFSSVNTEGYIVPELSAGLPSPIEIFVDACINKTGTPEGFGPDDGIVLTQLLENAYIANKENRTVVLSLD